MRHVKSVVTLSVLLIFGAINLVWAGNEAEERGYRQPLQELFQTEVVYPQEKGEIQLTLAPRFEEGDARDIVKVPLMFEYGITDAWQVGFEWISFINREPTDENEATTRGIGDLEIGTKYSFMNIGGSNFHAAVGFEVEFPLGNVNKELSEGFIEYEPFFVLAKDFPRLNNSHIFTRFGMGLVQRVKKHTDPDEDEPAAHTFKWDTGFFIPFWQLRFTTEFNWSHNEWNNDGEEDQKYLTPGLVWQLPKGWEVGIGVPIGLNKESDNYRVIGMLTYEFNVFGGDSD